MEHSDAHTIMRYAAVLGSSTVRALADDARKDEECVGFLAELPLLQQTTWLNRLRWLRLADRLAENELLEPDRTRFAAFVRGWRALMAGTVWLGEHRPTFQEMRAEWWDPASGLAREPLSIAAFDAYVAALGDYTRPGLALETLLDHDRMLCRLTGSLFGVFPYLLDSQRDAARGFGMLDQMMNNLRDIAEDSVSGLSFFPRDVLAAHGVAVESLLDGSAIRTAPYERMIRFWLDDHLVAIRARAAPFMVLTDLHPSLRAMRRSFLLRYARIQEVFRRCDFDYFAAYREYWQAKPRTPR